MQSAFELKGPITRHKEGLDRLLAMWLDPKVLFYGDKIPGDEDLDPVVFLAGPTSRDAIPDYIWRKDAVHFLRQYGFKGYILVPEPRGYSNLAEERKEDFTDAQLIYEWEYEGLQQATHRVFWIPRNKEQLLALTTNREIGQWMGRAENNPIISDNLYIGWPDNAIKMGSLKFELNKSRVGAKEGDHFCSLEELCKAVALGGPEDDGVL